MKVTCDNVRKYEKNTLRGFFDLVMDGLLRINGCTVHCKGESYWIGLPAKQYTDKEGATKWQPVVEMPSERMQSLRDLVMPEVKAALEAPEQAQEPVAKHRQYGSTNKPPKAAPEPSGWAIPPDAGDLSDIGDEIPF